MSGEFVQNYSEQLNHFLLFAQSLAVGFFIGLERERHNENIAGLRTFTLIALTGSLAGYVDQKNSAILSGGILLVVVMASLLVAQFKSQKSEPETTTVVAGALTFGLGYLFWLGHPVLPIALAISVTSLLYFREELRTVPKLLSKQDIRSFLQFSALAFVLLPILPNTNFGPYNVINPFQIGWLVVLLSGLSFVGYIALRFFNRRSGVVIVGLLGGLASTTATTLVYAKHSKRNPELKSMVTNIILLAHLVLFLRVAVIVSVISPTSMPVMAPWLIGGFGGGAIFLGCYYFYAGRTKDFLPKLETRNPTEVMLSLGFALAFSAILVLVAWMNDVFSDTGVYLVAFFSGLTDLDAIAVSNLKLITTGNLLVDVANIAIVIAFIANLIFKFGLVFFVADKSLRAPTALGFVSLVIGVGAGILARYFLI